MSVVSPEFIRLLSVYNDNYVAYRVTGNIANKTAYERALNEINRQIGTLQQTVGKDKDYIQGFLQTYNAQRSTLCGRHMGRSRVN
jgi:hypothetical protein